MIREIRENQGLSVRELAKRSGLSVSLISQIENGLRKMTPDTSKQLASALGIPEAILLTDSKKRLQQVLEDLNPEQQLLLVKRLSDEAISRDFETRAISSVGTSKMPADPTKGTQDYFVAPYLKNLTSNKTGPAYRAHSYHTKVPPSAIKTLIEHYTKPGDTVLDSFCGSGMTGVACRETKRQVILNDLSPAAIHISSGYLAKPNLNELRSVGSLVLKHLEEFCGWLYQTKDGDAFGVANYFIWSDVFVCPTCKKEQDFFWTAYTFDKHKGTFSPQKKLECHNCKTLFSKDRWSFSSERIVAVNERKGSSKRLHTRLATLADKKHFEWISKIKNPYWYPTHKFDRSYEMWRKSHEQQGIDDVSKFFTRRTLLALSYLNDFIRALAVNKEVKSALLFSFTACINRASKRYQFNHKRPTNVMTGTLYIASARYEWNVYDLFKRKLNDALEYYRSMDDLEHDSTIASHVRLGSATNLAATVADSSVDFVFIDPPFGSNIYYSDCSLLWESWINSLTNRDEEAVVSAKHSERSVARYGQLIGDSLKEVFRVLKPGRYCVVEFANTDADVWSSLYGGIQSSGLELISAGELSKGQKSFKGLRDAKEFVSTKDAIITLRRPLNINIAKTKLKPSREISDNKLNGLMVSFMALNQNLSLTRSDADLYSNFLTMVMTEQVDPVCINREKFLARLNDYRLRSSHPGNMCETYRQIDFMNNLESTSSAAYSTSIEPPPIPSNPKTSIFYGTHSYPTKVPPEYIARYIQEETKPGDVILDPFCGTGMTGVAAKIMGRNAIISDIGTLATHIAFNNVRECSAEQLGKYAAEVLTSLRQLEQNPYLINSGIGAQREIKFLIWSESYACQACGQENFYWDMCIDPQDYSLNKIGHCEKCKRVVAKDSSSPIRNLPAFIAYTTPNSGTYVEEVLSKRDRENLSKFSGEKKDSVLYKFKISKSREMYIRSALHLRSIENAADFFTPRNLAALELLYSRIKQISDARIRAALMFAFTNTAWHGSKMRRFNNKGGHRPLSGTLYIPQLISEGNVFDIFERKIRSLQKFYNHINAIYQPSKITIAKCDATKLADVSDNSIDYVFTDPPFGSNIFYADCNIIGEAWLGELTDTSAEAVQNKSLKSSSGGKTSEDYIEIMRKAFEEISRTLKKGKKAHVVFNNTDGTVWANLISAAEAAGLALNGAKPLDKIQKSMKGYKSSNGLENVAVTDLVLEFYNQKIVLPKKHPKKTVSNEMVIEQFKKFKGKNIVKDARFVDATFFADLLLVCHGAGISTRGITYSTIRDILNDAGLT